MPETAMERRVAALRYDYAAVAADHPPGCNLCKAADQVVKVADRDRYGYAATLMLCRRCGLAYLSPRLSAIQYEHFYAEIYRPLVSAYHGRRIDADTVQEEQRVYATELAPFLLPRLASAPRTILDVGGSTGVVGTVLAEPVNAAVSVLDPAPAELAIAHEAGLETIAGFIEDFDPGGRTWDLVLLCQTIDHLTDANAALATLRRLTAPAGRAYVDIVDVDILLRRIGRVEGVAKIDHPYYFTRATAAALFHLTGFSIVAERLSDDGHRGFVLAPSPCVEPDWAELAAAADEFLALAEACGA